MEDQKEVTYETEVIEDARTGEEIPTGIQKVQSNTLATSLDLTKVGTTVLDEKAESVLAEPLDPKDVNIRPDGLVYLPWTWYADRLNRAFGRLGWGLVPQSGPMTKDMGSMVLVVWGHWLVVRGIPVGFEMGETAYRPDNHQMSFGDAAAGAKSNSLARNCKMLGMSLELWNQEWVKSWREQYAETYENPKNRKTEWRKKKANGQSPFRTARNPEVLEQKQDEPAKVEKAPIQESVEPVVDGKTEPVYEDLLSWTDLKAKEKEIALATGLSKAKVAIGLASFDKTGSYSYQEVLKKLKGA